MEREKTIKVLTFTIGGLCSNKYTYNTWQSLHTTQVDTKEAAFIQVDIAVHERTVQNMKFNRMTQTYL